MLETLRAWLNGKREYWAGVLLYQKLGNNAGLKTLFAKGQTDYSNSRLQSELLKICAELKDKRAENQSDRLEYRNTSPDKTKDKKTPYFVEPALPTESPLYQAAKAQADKAYKSVMNKRAVLFSLAPLDDYTEQNTEPRIAQREKLALEIVTEFNDVSRLYDKADYIKKNGRLPDQPADPEETKVEDLPDHLVKPTLDNIRKNYNKMKNREKTPERVMLLEKHLSDIHKLEERWKELKNKNRS